MRINLTTRQWVAGAIGLILVIYVLFQARFLILGPQISIAFPRDGEEVVEPLILAHGEAHNVAWVEINGRQIFTDENGGWEEKLLLSPGPSIITLKGRDRFGREKEQQVRVILLNSNPIIPPEDDQEETQQNEGEL